LQEKNIVLFHQALFDQIVPRLKLVLLELVILVDLQIDFLVVVVVKVKILDLIFNLLFYFVLNWFMADCFKKNSVV